jgi:hypothetical protein
VLVAPIPSYIGLSSSPDSYLAHCILPPPRAISPAAVLEQPCEKHRFCDVCLSLSWQTLDWHQNVTIQNCVLLTATGPSAVRARISLTEAFSEYSCRDTYRTTDDFAKTGSEQQTEGKLKERLSHQSLKSKRSSNMQSSTLPERNTIALSVEERSFPTEKRRFAETRSGQPYGKAAICQDTLGTTVWKPQTRALAGVRRTHQRILSAPNF